MLIVDNTILPMRVTDGSRLQLGVLILRKPLAHSRRQLFEIVDNVLGAWASEFQVKEADFLARSDQLRHLNSISVEQVGKIDDPQRGERLPLRAHVKRQGRH